MKWIHLTAKYGIFSIATFTEVTLRNWRKYDQSWNVLFSKPNAKITSSKPKCTRTKLNASYCRFTASTRNDTNQKNVTFSTTRKSALNIAHPRNMSLFASQAKLFLLFFLRTCQPQAYRELPLKYCHRRRSVFFLMFTRAKSFEFSILLKRSDCSATPGNAECVRCASRLNRIDHIV